MSVIKSMQRVSQVREWSCGHTGFVGNNFSNKVQCIVCRKDITEEYNNK